MNISIFGLGYVGCVSLGCLAQNGHNVIGIDISELKVNLINEGKSTIIEKDIDKIIYEQRVKKKLYATLDYKEAVEKSDVSIICVGTPSTDNGHLNLDYIFQTANQIGQALKGKKSFHIIVIRSTVLPGTNSKVGKIISEISGKKRNVDFSIVSNPEFLREGSAVTDYYNPAISVLGGDNNKSLEIIESIYSDINAPIIKTNIEVAEIIKYINNTFHALKICFANEVGNICKKMNIDSHEVMDLFCLDKQLNISSYYLKPGFAYGGSCLPKDLKAFRTIAHDHYIDTPILNNIENSNSIQKEIALDLIIRKNKNKILFLGISFKAGTDDLRNSPIVDLIETLNGKGYEIRFYDNHVKISKLIGENRSYIMEKLPHIAQNLSSDLVESIKWAEIIVFGNGDNAFRGLTIPPDKCIIDLVRFDEYRNHSCYNGIGW